MDCVIAPYGVRQNDLTERAYTEEPHPLRTEFQRDRDRIVHSRAFRRLEYKTQVFVNQTGDNYRTRLTHSIEVSQISRTVARALHVNEDLAETLALAHDLGHPPFGHAGERAINQLMASYGGFDHNCQTMRLVEKIEKRYPGFPGLNLTQATRLGLRKHESLPEGMSHTLEAQIVDICDEIAYNNHDLDDGLEIGYLHTSDLFMNHLWKTEWEKTTQGYPDAGIKVQLRFTIRNLINVMVKDLIENSRKNLEKYRIQNLEDVLKIHEKTGTGIVLITFSEEIARDFYQMKEYLFNHLYRHPQVVKMNSRAGKIIHRIFDFFQENPDALPEDHRDLLSTRSKERVIADFIAGMTDRYAQYWNRTILGMDDN